MSEPLYARGVTARSVSFNGWLARPAHFERSWQLLVLEDERFGGPSMCFVPSQVPS